jgi:Family of unknown function (DUF6491)
MNRAIAISAALLLAAAPAASFAQGDGDGALPEDASDSAREPREVDIDAGGEPPAEEACFNVREVRNFTALDDRFVYIEGARDEHYLLTMAGVCIGLEDSFQIAISNELSRVCSIDFGKITYRGLGGRAETCSIREVEAVEDRAAAEQLVESRKRGRGDRDEDRDEE